MKMNDAKHIAEQEPATAAGFDFVDDSRRMSNCELAAWLLFALFLAVAAIWRLIT